MTRRKKTPKIAARVRSADGSLAWFSLTKRTERQAARMNNVRRDIVLDEQLVAPPVSDRYPSGAEILARADYARRHPPKVVPAPRRFALAAAHVDLVLARSEVVYAELVRGQPAPPRRATLVRRVWDFLTDKGSVESEAQSLARSRLARERAARASAEVAAREAIVALPYVGLDRLLRSADFEALEWDYHRQLEWDASNPERRERWIAEWVRDHPRPSYGPEIIDSERGPRSVWDPARYPRPLTIHYAKPAWARSPESLAADAYDAALRSGQIRWWWLRIEAEREEQRRAKAEAFASEMARKHPGADPSKYGVLAIRDAEREKAERTAAKYREMDLDRERERELERKEKENATRAKYGLPETVPIVPPGAPPGTVPETDSTENKEPVYSTPPPTGVVLSKPGNKQAVVSPGVSPGVSPPPDSPPEPGRGEPAVAVSPKASPKAPGAGAEASREAPGTHEGASSVCAGGSGGPGPAPSPPVRLGRPRLYNFDPSEARRLKSLGFTTAEIVRMLNLPDTPTTRRRVREACEE